MMTNNGYLESYPLTRHDFGTFRKDNEGVVNELQSEIAAIHGAKS